MIGAKLRMIEDLFLFSDIKMNTCAPFYENIFNPYDRRVYTSGDSNSLHLLDFAHADTLRQSYAASQATFNTYLRQLHGFSSQPDSSETYAEQDRINSLFSQKSRAGYTPLALTS